MEGSALPGALVISLDFELLWGLRDHLDAAEVFGAELQGARDVVPSLLEMFQEFEVAATWATVGFLFAESRKELEQFSPALKPDYLEKSLSPYSDRLGENEADDPLHFAPSLIEQIAGTPHQEVATHTFSHYYCGEPGQTIETFKADLAAAKVISGRRGYRLRSIVFPRNQVDPRYTAVLPEFGIRCYRGNPLGAAWAFSDSSDSRRTWRRISRLGDRYVGRSNGLVPWDSILREDGLSDVRATCFLAPYRPSLRGLERQRLRRLAQRIRAAARDGAVVHLWWHPHNFGRYQSANLQFLRAVLAEFAACRERYGMRSLSMEGVDQIVRKQSGWRDEGLQRESS